MLAVFTQDAVFQIEFKGPKVLPSPAHLALDQEDRLESAWLVPLGEGGDN